MRSARPSPKLMRLRRRSSRWRSRWMTLASATGSTWVQSDRSRWIAWVRSRTKRRRCSSSMRNRPDQLGFAAPGRARRACDGRRRRSPARRPGRSCPGPGGDARGACAKPGRGAPHARRPPVRRPDSGRSCPGSRHRSPPRRRRVRPASRSAADSPPGCWRTSACRARRRAHRATRRRGCACGRRCRRTPMTSWPGDRVEAGPASDASVSMQPHRRESPIKSASPARPRPGGRQIERRSQRRATAL